ncbi:MAG: hypothetical protein ABDH49_06460 [Candidatus Hydrothermales bacterium]
MIVLYPSSLYFSDKLEFFYEEGKRVYVIKSEDLLKAEIFAINLIRSFEKPYYSIYFELDSKNLLLTRVLKIVNEHLKETGIPYYSFKELKNFFRNYIIFLPYIPQSLINFLKNLSEFFPYLKFVALSNRDVDEDFYKIDVDELRIRSIDSLLKNVYLKFEEFINFKDEIRQILTISLNFPFVNLKVLSEITGLYEDLLIESLIFINKNLFPLYKVKKNLGDKNFYLTLSKFLREKFCSLFKFDKAIYKKIGEFYEREKLTENAIEIYLEHNDFKNLNDLLEKNLLRAISDNEFSEYVRYFIKSLDDKDIGDFPALLTLKGDYYIRNYDLKRAEDLIKKSSEISGENIRPYIKITELNLFWEKGEDEKIINSYEKLSKEDLPKPLKAYLLYRAGGSFLLLEKIEEAEECLFHSLSLAMDTGNIELALDVSHILGYLIRSFHCELESAINLFKKRAYTPTISTRNVIALFNLGYVYAFLGMFKEANECLDELESLIKLLGTPDQTSYFYLKGIIHLFKREFKEAICSFEEVLNLAKRPVTIFNISIYIAKLYFLVGEVEKGFSYIKKATESYSPESTLEKSSVYIAKAMGFYKSKRKDELIQLLNELKDKEKFLTNEEKIIFYYLWDKIFGGENKERLFENFLNKIGAVNFIEGF